jgi:hypothetical protein
LQNSNRQKQEEQVKNKGKQEEQVKNKGTGRTIGEKKDFKKN